jgi:hypothetical protein
MSDTTISGVNHSPGRTGFTPAGRWAAAAVLVTGATLQVVEFALEDPPDDNKARVAEWVAHPDRIAASMTAGLVAVPFLLLGFAVLVVITREHSRRLAIAAGVLLVLAMCGLAAIHGAEMTAFSQATGGHPVSAVSVLDSDNVVAPMVALLLMFLGGALLGTLALAAAIWRSPRLPRIAAVGVIAFAVLDFALGAPLVSHVVALANALVLAWAVVTAYSRTADKLTPS